MLFYSPKTQRHWMPSILCKYTCHLNGYDLFHYNWPETHRTTLWNWKQCNCICLQDCRTSYLHSVSTPIDRHLFPTPTPTQGADATRDVGTGITTRGRWHGAFMTFELLQVLYLFRFLLLVSVFLLLYECIISHFVYKKAFKFLGDLKCELLCLWSCVVLQLTTNKTLHSYSPDNDDLQWYISYRHDNCYFIRFSRWILHFLKNVHIFQLYFTSSEAPTMHGTNGELTILHDRQKSTVRNGTSMNV
jgi:hypothetical protein